MYKNCYGFVRRAKILIGWHFKKCCFLNLGIFVHKLVSNI